MSKSNPWPAEKREAQLREIAGKLAGKYGAKNITRRMIAKQAECSEPLVSSYLGSVADIQNIARREARKLGLKPPTGKEEAAIGAKLRAHKPGDPRDTRKRSVKEVKAVKEKAVPVKKLPARSGSYATAAATAATRRVTKSAATGASSPPANSANEKPKPKPASPLPPERKPTAPPERKTAARPPKLPPLAPPEPLL